MITTDSARHRPAAPAPRNATSQTHPARSTAAPWHGLQRQPVRSRRSPCERNSFITKHRPTKMERKQAASIVEKQRKAEKEKSCCCLTDTSGCLQIPQPPASAFCDCGSCQIARSCRAKQAPPRFKQLQAHWTTYTGCAPSPWDRRNILRRHVNRPSVPDSHVSRFCHELYRQHNRG